MILHINLNIVILTDFQRELHTAKYLDEVPHVQPTLDEITNKVFEELLVGKSRNKYQYSEGSCKVGKTISEIREYAIFCY